MHGDFDEDELDDEDGDPECSWCGCDLFTEEHEWDCPYVDEDEDDDEDDDEP